MAWDFGSEVHALTGFEGDGSGTDTVTGETFRVHVNQWLNDGVKEVVKSLPATLLEKCTEKTVLSTTNGVTKAFDTATIGKVLYCTRTDGSSIERPCRFVSSNNAGLVGDSTADNYFAPADGSDPAYFLKDNLITILPTPTDAQPGNIYHVLYPSALTYDDSSISNFPDEAEYLVVLYAAIRAVQERLSNEASNEDSELYALHSDKYTKLSAEYQKGLSFLKGG